jgi:threonine dehydrogenase-like Zn-dependent dehydrogenase
VTLDVSNHLLRRQVTLIGSWTSSTTGQAECARFIANGAIDVDHLFAHYRPREQVEEAYRFFETQTTGKGVVYPS